MSPGFGSVGRGDGVRKGDGGGGGGRVRRGMDIDSTRLRLRRSPDPDRQCRRPLISAAGLVLRCLWLFCALAVVANSFFSAFSLDSALEAGSPRFPAGPAAGIAGDPPPPPPGPGPLARGVAGLPASRTPALEGGRRGHIQCDVDVDQLAYWNDPQGERDLKWVSPFAETQSSGGAKYLTFQPDSGGWNNIRMSLEIIFIMALALGRTLVLPPPMPLYLLNKGSGNRHRSFANFYPLQAEGFQERLEVISTEEFLRREGGTDGRFPIPAANRTAVARAAGGCAHRKKDPAFCGIIDHYLQTIGTSPGYDGKNGCFIFDAEAFRSNGTATPDVAARVDEFCSRERTPFYISSELQDAPVLHFRASERGRRLLQHFYGALLFTDPLADNYFKRFVRDFMHYHDEIYCAAGKIVAALQEEAADLGFPPDADGSGGYSALHIRRGDLQYKKVKISAEEWYTNTREHWRSGELLYIATDERNATWFDPIREHHKLRFLDDYADLAGLADLDPNYMGMIDTIVAGRGRAFAGTYFSTFSGYINRLRGYSGLSMKQSIYSYEPRKYEMFTWFQGPFHVFSKEWPAGWIGIDGDETPSQVFF